MKGMFQGSPLAPPPTSGSCAWACLSMALLGDEFETVQFKDEDGYGSVDSTNAIWDYTEEEAGKSGVVVGGKIFCGLMSEGLH